MISEISVNPIAQAMSAKAQQERHEEGPKGEKEKEMARMRARDMREAPKQAEEGSQVAIDQQGNSEFAQDETTIRQGGPSLHHGSYMLAQGGSTTSQDAATLNQQKSLTTPVSAAPDRRLNHDHLEQPPIPSTGTGVVRAADQNRQQAMRAAEQSHKQEIQRQAERAALLQRSIEARVMSERAEQESQYRAAWTRNAIDIFAANDTVDREIERQRQAQQVAKEKADQEERQRQHDQRIANEQIAKEKADQEEQRRQAFQVEQQRRRAAEMEEQRRRASEMEEQRRREAEAEQMRVNRAQLENSEIQTQMRLIAQKHRAALESADKDRQALIRSREHDEAVEKIEREKETRLRLEEQRAAEQAEHQRQLLIRQSEKKEADDRAEHQRQIRAAQQRAMEQLSTRNAAAEEERLARLKRAQATQGQTNEDARRLQNVGNPTNPAVSNEPTMPRSFRQHAQFPAHQGKEAPNSSTNTPIQPSSSHNGSGPHGPSPNVGNTGVQPGARPVSPAIIGEIRNAMLQIEVQITSTQAKLQQLQASTNDGNSVILKHVQQNVLMEQLRTLMNIHTKISAELQQQQQQARAENQARTVQPSAPSGYTAFMQRDQTHTYGQPQYHMAQNQHAIPNRPESYPSSYNQPHHSGPSNIPFNRTPVHAPHPAQNHNHDLSTSSISPVSHQSFNHVPNPMVGQMQTQPQGPLQSQASHPGLTQPQERRESNAQARLLGQPQWQPSIHAHATTNGPTSAQSPSQSTSPALSQGRNSIGSNERNGPSPLAQRDEEERTEQRKREEDALQRLRELEDRERKREEEYARNKEAELEREAKRLAELRESQQTILRQQELIFQQSQLIASQQLQNHSVQNATSSELVTQGQLYMQNLSQAMQTHERLLRAQQFNLGIVQSPQVFGEPTPAFVDSAPPLTDAQPFDILDIGPLPGENVQQDTADRFTEIHENPPAHDSVRTGHIEHQQGSLSRPGTAETRASKASVPNFATPLRDVPETASQVSSIRNTQSTASPIDPVAKNPLIARTAEHATQGLNEAATYSKPSRVPQLAQGAVSSSIASGFIDHPVMTNVFTSERSQPNSNNLSTSSSSQEERNANLQQQQMTTSLSVPFTVPSSAPLTAPVSGPVQHNAIQEDKAEEARKPIILPYGPPRSGVMEKQIQTAYTPAPVIQNAKAMALGPLNAMQRTSPVMATVNIIPTPFAASSTEHPQPDNSRVRERSDSGSVQSSEERPVKRRRTDQVGRLLLERVLCWP